MSIINRFIRNNRNLNVLVSPTHEGNEYNTAKTGFNYYALTYEGSKPWRTEFRPIPDNYHIMNFLPYHIDVDVVISQTKFGQFQRFYPLAKQLQAPLISVEHTLPIPQWGYRMKQDLKNMRGDMNVFISEHSAKEWLFDLDDPKVKIIRHGIDTDTFCPDSTVEKRDVVFTCANDFINRDYCLGYYAFRRVTDGLPVRIMGMTEGLSEPSKSIEELVNAYRSSRVFINTTTLSPIPTVVMEAMSCGLPVVSTNNCMLPEVIEHGVSGFLSNNEAELRDYLQLLLHDVELCEKMGHNARERILNEFSNEKFIQNWKSLIYSLV